MNRNMYLIVRLSVATVVLGGAAASVKPHHHTHASNVEGYHVSQPKPGYKPVANPLPGMPPVVNSQDIYSEGRPGNLSPTVRGFRSLVYVPNSDSDTVDIIDPHSFKVVDHFEVGRQPQHVTPSWDLKTLWVLNDKGDSLTRIDPATGKKGETVRVDDPYNMYY